VHRRIVSRLVVCSGAARVQLVVLAAAAIASTGVNAQPVPEATADRPWPLLVGGGVVGGVVGFGGGVLAGRQLVLNCEGGGCVFLAVFPPLIGGIVGAPVGVNLMNRRRVEVGETIAFATVGAALGGLLAGGIARLAGASADQRESAALVAVPLGQIFAAVAYETHARRRRGGTPAGGAAGR
jgi:MFS family permease